MWQLFLCSCRDISGSVPFLTSWYSISGASDTKEETLVVLEHLSINLEVISYSPCLLEVSSLIWVLEYVNKRTLGCGC